ncbi:hypothetical protein LET1_00036 [Pectobacterium phage LET1]|nr:hypothetical protein LET1_00036 [Pectobacterium phage LET1]
MAYHDLKIDPEFFEPILVGLKTAELRPYDEGYKVGDWLILREYHNGYTGRQVSRKVAHIDIVLPGYVLMSII